MATTIMQVRIDDELKAQASEVFEQLGLDIPTAIRMFMRRAVLVNGIPFSMTLPEKEYRSDIAVRAMHSMGETAKRNGTSEMTLEEINAEIDAVRAENPAKGSQA